MLTRCFVSVTVSFDRTIQYFERSLLLLVTSAADLPMHRIKFCSVLFDVSVDTWHSLS